MNKLYFKETSIEIHGNWSCTYDIQTYTISEVTLLSSYKAISS